MRRDTFYTYNVNNDNDHPLCFYCPIVLSTLQSPFTYVTLLLLPTYITPHLPDVVGGQKGISISSMGFIPGIKPMALGPTIMYIL